MNDCPAYCWPSLGLGNTTGAEILQETFLIDPLLYHAVRTAVRRLTDVSHSSPELKSCRETSGDGFETDISRMCFLLCPSICCCCAISGKLPSRGAPLSSPSKAVGAYPQGTCRFENIDVSKAGCALLVKLVTQEPKNDVNANKLLYRRTQHQFPDSWILLGLGTTAGAEILEGDVWRALQSVSDVVGP